MSPMISVPRVSGGGLVVNALRPTWISVTISNPAANVLINTAIDGTRAFDGLPPGEYTLTAQAEGFERQIQSVTLRTNERRTVDFSMQPATVPDYVDPIITGIFFTGAPRGTVWATHRPIGAGRQAEIARPAAASGRSLRRRRRSAGRARAKVDQVEEAAADPRVPGPPA